MGQENGDVYLDAKWDYRSLLRLLGNNAAFVSTKIVTLCQKETRSMQYPENVTKESRRNVKILLCDQNVFHTKKMYYTLAFHDTMHVKSQLF